MYYGLYKPSKLGILNKANIKQELYTNFYAEFPGMSYEWIKINNDIKILPYVQGFTGVFISLISYVRTYVGAKLLNYSQYSSNKNMQG